MSTTTYTGETGCLIGGHHGWRGTVEVIHIARAYGFTLEDEDQELIDRVDANNRMMDATADEWWDAIVPMSDDAEEYLNEHIAPEGYQFGWYDGEFYLSSDEQWGEEAW